MEDLTKISRNTQVSVFMLERVVEEALAKLSGIHRDMLTLMHHARTGTTAQEEADFIDDRVGKVFQTLRNTLTEEVKKYDTSMG